MRRAILGGLFVLVVIAAVLVLRQAPPAPQPTPDTGTVAMPPEPVTRTAVTDVPWLEQPLPQEVDQAHRSEVDRGHGYFPVRGQDGVRRFISRTAGPPTEIARGTGTEPLIATLDGPRLIVHEVSGGKTAIFSINSDAGARTTTTLDFPATAVAVAGGFVGAQDTDRCLTILEATWLNPWGVHCAAPNRSISLLTAERDSVQWRETTSGEQCATWYRLTIGGTAEQLNTSDRACRAASLIRTNGWELTADFPPYEAGVLTPGPLVARLGTRQIALDNFVLDVHPCGGHVYWLSKPGNDDERGDLNRWVPGESRVEVLTIEPGANSSPPRCVNGVLNMVTYGTGSPRLWILYNP
ncbi:MAG: hypothetical protein ABW215_20065 [Kibdelosporangium sp.]